MMPTSFCTRFLYADSIAVGTRLSFPPHDNTDQLCAIESILHSSSLLDPSGVPSSNQARLYHSPSQALLSIFCFNCCACFLHALANGASLCNPEISANRISIS